MAYRFDASGDMLSRSLGSFSISTLTFLWRARIVTDRIGYSCFLSLDNGSDYFVIETDTDGVTVGHTCNYGGGWQTVGAMTVGTWYDIALVNSSGTGRVLYLGATGSTTAMTSASTTHSNATLTLTMYHGNNGFGEWLNGRMAGFKMWTAALTAAQLEQERLSLPPVFKDNLWGYWPGYNHTDLADMSGNGRTLTAGGTLTTEDGPPVSSQRCKSRLILPASAAPPATAYPWHYYQQMGAC